MPTDSLSRKPDNSPKAVIASAIRAARARQRLTQEEVAHRAGIQQSRVSELEAESGNPKLETVARVADVLGLRITVEESAA